MNSLIHCRSHLIRDCRNVVLSKRVSFRDDDKKKSEHILKLFLSNIQFVRCVDVSYNAILSKRQKFKNYKIRKIRIYRTYLIHTHVQQHHRKKNSKNYTQTRIFKKNRKKRTFWTFRAFRTFSCVFERFRTVFDRFSEGVD